MKRILIAGASGMIGNEILKQALSSPQVASVSSLVRRKSDVQHEKLKEYVVSDFLHYEHQSAWFENIDAAYFCIGVYTGQLPDEQFKAITVDYAVAFAHALKEYSPTARLCLLSGAGADRTEKSTTAFARYKGMAENQIAALDMKFHTFRPGYIYPVSPRKEPNFMYKMMRSLYPVFKLMGDKYSIQSTDLARAMFLVGLQGAKQEVLENKDIVDVAKMA